MGLFPIAWTKFYCLRLRVNTKDFSGNILHLIMNLISVLLGHIFHLYNWQVHFGIWVQCTPCLCIRDGLNEILSMVISHYADLITSCWRNEINNKLDININGEESSANI